MREAIQILINQIHEEVNMIRRHTLGEETYQGDLFNLVGSFSVNQNESQVKSDTNCLKGRKGVYLFVANDTFEVSTEQILSWNRVSSAPLISHDPQGNVIPATVHSGEIFYLGSCYSESGSLLSRLRQHCNYAADKSSLKLQNRNRQWVRQYLVAYYFAINKEYDNEVKRIILPAIERELHNSFFHLAGSKRT
ncbi:hypothetical protein SAMN02910353_01513 [Ruminococcus sp. YRD2003]|uniref:hypothetical protein n=1 Tax=Ruminococcus sp. YRD2003 TaxID=1452313 RepID=UPI0008D62CB5|nr:hypothetical protein SAMN02910353_01513 [Ruminococcus flavefaciens]